MRPLAPVVLACSLFLAATPAHAEERRPLLVTVDDLPVVAPSEQASAAERERIVRDLLAALRRHRVPAVAFVIWGHVTSAADEALLDLWLKEGHELGSHSFGHVDLTTTALDAYTADLEKARSGLSAFLARRQKSLRFFRFPYLCEGDTRAKRDGVRRYLAASGQRPVPVTIDDQDWSFDKPWTRAEGDEARQRVAADYLAMLRLAVRHHEETSDRLLGRTAPQILLLHANSVGAAQWDALFTWLEQTGHRFATADEVLADPALAEPPEFIAPYGCGLWDQIRAGRREQKAQEDVRALLARQADAWNAGDLEGFTSVYAEDASFATPSGLTQGREAVLARYRTRYATPEARGRLSLEPIELRVHMGEEVTPHGDAVPGHVQSVSVLARWRIEHTAQPAQSGLTLLVFRPRGNTWEIVQDASM
jgi:uncharacterized protein (TIGR02246 family)